MIQFNVAGFTIELERDADFSLSFKSSLFEFDSIELARTQAFDIPATPNNQAFFNYANNPARTGQQVRREYAAQCIINSVIINGILSILNYENRRYKAAFLYGNLTKLKEIKDVGNIGNYTNFTDTLTVNRAVSPITDVSSPILPYNFRFYNYNNGVPDAEKNNTKFNFMPSVKLRHLIDTACDSLNISVEYSDVDLMDSAAIILNSQKQATTPQTLTVSGSAKSGYTITANTYLTQASGYTFQYNDLNAEPVTQNASVYVFEANLDIELQISNYSGAWKLGIYNGSKFITKSGSTGSFLSVPAGAGIVETLKINKGEFFAFVVDSDWDYNYNWFSDDFDGAVVNYSFMVREQAVNTIQFNGTYSLQANLPQITLIDLLKTIAAITNTAIQWDERTLTISFFNFSFPTTFIDLNNKLIEVSKVSRSVGSYAQKNIVKFSSGDYVQENLKYLNEKSINNETLEKEKVIYTVPLNEANMVDDNAYVIDFVMQEDGTYKLDAKNPTLVIAGSSGIYFKHINTYNPIANNLSNILDLSTTINVKVFLRIGEFMKITDTTVFVVENNKYIAYSGNWSRNIADLELIKIQ